MATGLPANVDTAYSNRHNILDAIRRADLVVGAVLLPGAKAPHLIETVATTGYRFIADLGVEAPARRARPWRWWAAGAAAIAIAAGAWAVRTPVAEPARVTRIQQVTSSAMGGSRLASISKQKVSESVTIPLASPIFSGTPFTRAAFHSVARAPPASTILWAMESSCMTCLVPGKSHPPHIARIFRYRWMSGSDWTIR